MNSRISLLLMLYLAAIVSISDSPKTPEPQKFTHIMLRENRDYLGIFNLNEDGSYTLIKKLDNISLGTQNAAEWIIEVAVDIVPSPDGQHLAFTARSSNSDVKLFILSLNPVRLRDYDAPGLASLEWSPTSDALLLSSTSIFLSNESHILSNGDTYIFDLITQTYTLIAQTNETQLVRETTWSPTGDSVIYVAEQHSTKLPELFRVSRDGASREQLTNHATLKNLDLTKPADRNFCRIDKTLKWSVLKVRWYYLLICDVFNEYALPSLLSVGLNGDTRLEIDLYEMFSSEFDPSVGSGYRVIDFFPDAMNGDVFLLIDPPVFEAHIVKISEPEQAEIVETFSNASFGDLAAISKNKSHIATTLHRENAQEVMVLDLINQRVELSQASPVSHYYCRVQWLNANTVLIDEVQICNIGGTGFLLPRSIVAWNIHKNIIKDMTQEFENDFTFIISLP